MELNSLVRGVCLLALVALLSPSEDLLEFQITDDVFKQGYPAVYGDIVVWEDHRGSSSLAEYRDIYGYNLATEKEFQITSHPDYQERPAIYNTVVVWQDNRNGNYDIYGVNLETKQEFQITADTSDQTSPEIHQDIVVWADYRNSDPGDYSSGDIYCYNLSTKEEFPLITDLNDQILPAIYGETVVWMDSPDDSHRKYRKYNIYGCSLSDKEVFCITAGMNDHWRPAIHGEIVVWVGYMHDFSDIYGCNLKVMEKIKEADSFFDQGKAEFEEENYEAALDHFLEAQKIYMSVGSEKAVECDGWIQRISTKTESTPVTPGLLIPKYAVVILAGVLAGTIMYYFARHRTH
jgi:beta propeller repeat protein